jgi:hypothetical protein
MIRYALRCDKGHEFEAWFRSSADYDRAAKAGDTACPVCGPARVEKMPMAPAIARGGGRGAEDRRPDRDAQKPAAKPEATEKPERVNLVAAPDPRQQALIQAMRELRRQVTEHADYVGDRFAEEARKIHYKESEARGIYGEATTDEAKKLIEEGIEFQPLPTFPEERN